jgi:hypothetical protein
MLTISWGTMNTKNPVCLGMMYLRREVVMIEATPHPPPWVLLSSDDSFDLPWTVP